ncbi:MAG TPA: HEAT repeat domain-containing protein, partial [Polyangiales bacterium]|nr:HEAT repeat domain-containing protein [Polyangiales bacterium]
MRAEQLEAALSSADIETRREAVVEAGQSRNRALAKPLLSALGDSDWRVREEAVRAVRDVAVEYDLLHGLIAGVAQGHNVGLRNAAREVLRALGSAAAHALVAALSEVEPTARKFLVEALACGGAEEAIDALVRAVRGDDALIAVSAMDALAQLGGERAVAALREKLRAPEPFERAAALDALLRLDVVLSWSELEPFLEDRVLRRVALPALGRSGDERALPYLVAALSEKSTHLASRALVGLQRLYMLGGTLRGALTRALASLAPDVRQRVRGFARDDDSAVAFAACLTLACARDPETLGLAVELCSRGVPASELALALSSWGEEAIVLLARLASGNGGARVAAIDIASELCVLRRPGASTAALLGDAVRDALGDHESWVRRAGLRALPRFVEARDAMVLVVHAQREEAELAQLAGAALRVLAERERDAVRDALAQSTMTGSAASVLAELAVEVGVVDTLGRLREALLSDEAQ